MASLNNGDPSFTMEDTMLPPSSPLMEYHWQIDEDDESFFGQDTMYDQQRAQVLGELYPQLYSSGIWEPKDEERTDALSTLVENNATMTDQDTPASTSAEVPIPQKRPASADAGEGCQRQNKGLRTSPLSTDAGSIDELSQSHAPNGVHEGRHRCTCGWSYSKNSALKRHIESASGHPKYICRTCKRPFTRKDSLRRHVETEHEGKRMECPGCGQRFRSDYLAKHIASPRYGDCRLINEALQLNEIGVNIVVHPAPQGIWIPEMVKTITRARHAGMGLKDDRQAANDAADLLAMHGETLAKAVWEYTGMTIRPAFRSTGEACALCWRPLCSNEQELIDHIKHHSLELTRPRIMCYFCSIDFMFAADYQRHLDAASQDKCGFHHPLLYDGEDKAICFSGHHPPSNDHTQNVSHGMMYQTLLRWEHRQMQAHRVAIARIQAELLLHSQSTQHSLGDDELICIEAFSRLTIGSIESFHSVPAWLRYLDRMSTDSTQSKVEIATRLAQRFSAQSARPAASRELGRPLNAFDRPKNTYLEQLKAMRSAGGLKRTASEVRYRAKAATRYLLPDHGASKDSRTPQYVTVEVAG